MGAGSGADATIPWALRAFPTTLGICTPRGVSTMGSRPTASRVLGDPQHVRAHGRQAVLAALSTQASLCQEERPPLLRPPGPPQDPCAGPGGPQRHGASCEGLTASHRGWAGYDSRAPRQASPTRRHLPGVAAVKQSRHSRDRTKQSRRGPESVASKNGLVATRLKVTTPMGLLCSTSVPLDSSAP
jgi:hypothetical protein